MNIMLVSVKERTREIGIRMAVGAPSSSILFQFLIEASCLSLLGGLLGVGFGWGAKEWIAATYGWPVVTPTGSVVMAFSFSAGIGLLFGSYPAYLASRLEPVEALRYE